MEREIGTDYLKKYINTRREYKELELRFLSMSKRYQAIIDRLKSEILNTKVTFKPQMGDFEKVLQSVCLTCDVTPAQLLGSSREGTVKDARHMTVYILRHHYGMRFKDIGKKLGGRDHSTAINSYNRCRDFLEFDKDYRKMYNTVKQLLNICN